MLALMLLSILRRSCCQPAVGGWSRGADAFDRDGLKMIQSIVWVTGSDIAANSLAVRELASIDIKVSLTVGVVLVSLEAFTVALTS